MPEEVWMDLSYNYIEDESCFFPAWAWGQKPLWQPYTTPSLERQYQELIAYAQYLSKILEVKSCIKEASLLPERSANLILTYFDCLESQAVLPLSGHDNKIQKKNFA